MLSFLPALILLLLHGPANLEGRLAQAPDRAEVGAQLPASAPVSARSNRAFLAELLRSFPGATVLAALADEPESQPEPKLETKPVEVPAYRQPAFSAPPATNQRDRDGPATA